MTNIDGPNQQILKRPLPQHIAHVIVGIQPECQKVFRVQAAEVAQVIEAEGGRFDVEDVVAVLQGSVGVIALCSDFFHFELVVAELEFGPVDPVIDRFWFFEGLVGGCFLLLTRQQTISSMLHSKFCHA